MNYQLQQIQVQVFLNKYRHGKQTSQKIRWAFCNNWVIDFILATYLIGDKQNVWKTSHLETVFNVNGLQIGNNVHYVKMNCSWD
jgi:hypothetical protein